MLTLYPPSDQRCRFDIGLLGIFPVVVTEDLIALNIKEGERRIVQSIGSIGHIVPL